MTTKLSPASCCSVYLESFGDTALGRMPFGFATGFLYAGRNGTRWLVTNWHVVTGRRPDEPGTLIGQKPQSPDLLRFKVENPANGAYQEVEVSLYDEGGPKWLEGDREGGVDLALVRLHDPPQFPFPYVQTFAPNSNRHLVPGLDVLMIGHPFKLGLHAQSAIWKGAMIASEQSPLGSDRPWVLIDAPGVPGMSGSPVYRRHLDPYFSDAEVHSLPGHVAPTEEGKNNAAVKLELLGVYAGSVGQEMLDKLKLGRVFPADLIEKVLRDEKQGCNPFPPSPIR